MIDLELIADSCKAASLTLRYLGFNSGAEDETQTTIQRIATQVIQETKAIDDRSTVVQSDILDLSSPRSMATRKMREFESFDVVNLDFCDTVTGGLGNHVHTAIKNVVEYQVTNRTQPWLFFLTTSISVDAMNGTDLARYGELFLRNIGRSNEFKRELAAIFPGSSAAQNPGDFFANLNSMKLGQLVTVGIGKWLLSLFRQGEVWSLELKSSYCYRRALVGDLRESAGEDHPNLFSLVFLFQKQHSHIEDPTGLARPSGASSSRARDQSEVKAAVQMARKVQRTEDLDLFMQNNPTIHDTMVGESERLLELRTYNTTTYRTWVQSARRITG
jgi:hypothetical protein